MPTPTYTLIDSVTLASSASSVTFSSIDQSFGDVIVAVDIVTGGNSVFTRFRFNADAITEVEWVMMQGDGSSATTGAFGGTTEFQTFSSTSSSILHTLQLMDYSATDKHTTGLYRGNAANSQVRASAVRWLNTAAITSLEIASASNQFQAGSTFFLYGIAKAL